MIKNMIKKADTPIKRLGFVGVVVGLPILILTSLHWNFTKKAFIYEAEYSYQVKIEKPKPISKDTYWKELSGAWNQAAGWALYSESCQDKLMPSYKRPINYKEPKQCEVDFKPHERVYYKKIESTLGKFLSESIDYPRGDYFWLNTPALILFWLGLTMYLGWAERFYKWSSNVVWIGCRKSLDWVKKGVKWIKTGNA